MTDNILTINFNKRPTCTNHGCNEPVHSSGKRWRPVCWRCHQASYGKRNYPAGVRPFRKGVCSNQESILDFPCPIDYEKAPWAKGSTQTDHMDGDPYNNHPDNLMELCQLCHQKKGMESGDYKNNQKKSG